MLELLAFSPFFTLLSKVWLVKFGRTTKYWCSKVFIASLG
jgi:hypothetical protein